MKKMSYMTVGTLQAFEALMVEKPGFNHYDSGCEGITPECRFMFVPPPSLEISILCFC
jgi:hypothetical protein